MPVIVQRLNTVHNVNNNPSSSVLNAYATNNELFPKIPSSKARVSFNKEISLNRISYDDCALENLNPANTKHDECESLIVNIDNGISNSSAADNNLETNFYADNDDIKNNSNHINSDLSNNNIRKNPYDNRFLNKNKSNYTDKLKIKKKLFEKRRFLSDWTSLSALAGIFLMILETELTLSSQFDKNSYVSIGIKSMISVSTFLLICLIIAYHHVQVRIFMMDNCIDDWLIAMTKHRILKIIFEITICIIHPIPGDYKVERVVRPISSDDVLRADVPIDLFLSLPMFFRLYLLGRSMLLHSAIFTNVSSRSIGALNRIDFNMRFVIKTLMTMYPGGVLVVFSLTIFLISSWTLRLCESFHDPRFGNLLTAMWAIAVTFLTIGYGDIVPMTYCGRTICIISGFMGVSCTAIMIAVFAQKLQLTRSEEYVHNFIIENKLKKRLKNIAANVIAETWLVYKYRKLRPNPSQCRTHQRKLLKAISILKHVKLEKKELHDESRAFIDLANTQKEALEMVSAVSKNQSNVEHRIKELECKIAMLQEKLSLCTEDLYTILEQIKIIIKNFEALPNQTLVRNGEPAPTITVNEIVYTDQNQSIEE